MNQQTYKVKASWDTEAQIWVAESENVPGLVTEAETIEILTEKLKEMIPELLILNNAIDIEHTDDIKFELICNRQELIKIAG